MSWTTSDGRECKLGWGYNKSLDQLIPVERDTINVKSEAVNQWNYWVYNLTSDRPICWASLFPMTKSNVSILELCKSFSGTELQKGS